MRTIGRYEIEAEIGRGAMGVVYRARDPELRRAVAVKTYALPTGLDEPHRQEFRRRFRREAQAAAALTHPAIVTVYDAGEDPASGLPFIAMEYVPGQSLAQLLQQQGTLPLERVVAMAESLAEALGAAHAAGIVHRDIKPANILIRESDGAVKIADFGVARVASSTLTQSGASLGSPAYMSPEQIRGRDLDGRSDLFSLAVILYELLCGKRPYGGVDISEVVYSVVHETPIPVSRLDPSLPESIDHFFDRALAKEPADRFAEAPELGRAFSRAASGAASAEQEIGATVHGPLAHHAERLALPPAPSSSEVSAPRVRRRGPWLAAAAAGVVAIGWLLLPGREAHLVLDGKSRVDGALTLKVDGDDVYERALNPPPQPEAQKKNLLKKISKTIAGPDYESFEALIDVDPGKREVEVVITPERGEPYRSALIVELEPGETRRLKLVAGRTLGSTLSFQVD